MFKKIIEFFKSLFKKKDAEENIEPVTSGETVDVVDSGSTVTDIDSGETVPSNPIIITNDNDGCENEPGFVSEYRILIDNGHGNDTAGKRSPWCANGVQPAIEFYEYKWNREIAKPIVEELKRRGYNADLLVTEENDISLEERVRRANAECSNYGAASVILVSVHANAAGNGKEWMTGRGWSAYTSRGRTKSDELAEFLYREAAKNFTGMKLRVDNSDGDSDQEADFYILKRTYCTAVLTENFFYDNVDDVQYILSDEGRKAVIKTHVDGIINYISQL